MDNNSNKSDNLNNFIAVKQLRAVRGIHSLMLKKIIKNWSNWKIER